MISPEPVTQVGNEIAVISEKGINWDDIGGRKNITSRYETRHDAMGAPGNLKRFTKVKLQGSPSTNYTIYTSVTQRPPQRSIDWGGGVSLTTNSSGFGQADIDALGAWIGVAVENSSQLPGDIYAISTEFTMRESML